jgi:hypothetical protein
MQLRNDSPLIVPDHVLSRGAAGETVLLNLNDEKYFALDDVGSRFWQLVEAGTTLDAVLAALMEEYEVDRQVLEEDLRSLINELVAAELLTLGAELPTE